IFTATDALNALIEIIREGRASASQERRYAARCAGRPEAQSIPDDAPAIDTYCPRLTPWGGLLEAGRHGHGGIGQQLVAQRFHQALAGGGGRLGLLLCRGQRQFQTQLADKLVVAGLAQANHLLDRVGIAQMDCHAMGLFEMPAQYHHAIQGAAVEAGFIDHAPCLLRTAWRWPPKTKQNVFHFSPFREFFALRGSGTGFSPPIVAPEWVAGGRLGPKVSRPPSRLPHSSTTMRKPP